MPSCWIIIIIIIPLFKSQIVLTEHNSLLIGETVNQINSKSNEMLVFEVGFFFLYMYVSYRGPQY